MGPADVVVGWMDGGDVHLVDQSTTALHHLNGADSQQDYELLSHGHSHGTTSIAFRRPLVTGDVQDRDLDGPELPFTWAVSDSTFPGHDASGSGILFASNGKWAVQEEESPSETWIWIPVTAVTAYVILLLTPGLLSQLFPPSFSAKVNRFLAKRPLQPRPRKRWDGPTLDIVPAIRDMQVADYCITALWFAATVAMLATPGEEPQGFMCAVALGTLFLPVTKHSIWAVALGSSFERYVRLHRWAARWTFLMLVAHLADQCGSQGADIFTANADDHGFGWVYGLVSFCIMVGFIPLTLEPIRRRYYELFYYTHFLAFPAVAFAMMHSYAVCYAMIPSLVLYFLDKGVQLWSMAHTYRIVKASPVAGGAKLVLQRPDARHRQCDPGQYYFLAIPSVSGLQRHPFTVAHVSSDLDSLTFLIKDMGPSTFTHQMCGLASPPGSNRALLCGPYGSLSLPQPLTQYQTVFLIAGGVGVTPMINIADSLLRSAVRMKVHFIWLSRDPCAFSEWFPEQLLGMMLSEDFEVRLHSTVRGKEQAMELEVQGEPYGAVDDPSSPVSLQDAALLHGMDAKQLELCMFSGRPDWATLFVPYAGAGPTVAVLTCGPAALVLDVQRAVQASRFDFHKECFSF
eukprot:GGOE01020689.1.p1 GENE.GGOE01020689.1~~GGOE01020689.1.p1  ORF type:complete len:702 (-),score=191.29 GGOE01020689.1:771-2654(-)